MSGESLQALNNKQLRDVYAFERVVRKQEQGQVFVDGEMKHSSRIQKLNILVGCASEVGRLTIEKNVSGLISGLDVKDDSKILIVQAEGSDDCFEISYTDSNGKIVNQVRSKEQLQSVEDWQSKAKNNIVITDSLTIDFDSEIIKLKVHSTETLTESTIIDLITKSFTKEQVLDLTEVYVNVRFVKDKDGVKQTRYTVQGYFKDELYSDPCGINEKSELKQPQDFHYFFSDKLYVSGVKYKKLLIKSLPTEANIATVISNVCRSVVSGIVDFFISILLFIKKLFSIDKFKYSEGHKPAHLFEKQKAEILKKALQDVDSDGSKQMSFESMLSHFSIVESMMRDEGIKSRGAFEIARMLRQGVELGHCVRDSQANESGKHRLVELLSKSLLGLNSKDANDRLLIPIPVREGRDAFVTFLVLEKDGNKIKAKTITLPANITGKGSKATVYKTYSINSLSDTKSIDLAAALVSICANETKMSKAEKGLLCTQGRHSTVDDVCAQFGKFIKEENEVKGSSDPLKAVMLVMQSLEESVKGLDDKEEDEDDYRTEDKVKDQNSLLKESFWGSKHEFYVAYVNKMLDNFERSSSRFNKEEKISILQSIDFYIKHTLGTLEKRIGGGEARIVVDSAQKAVSRKLQQLGSSEKESVFLNKLGVDKFGDCRAEIKQDLASTPLLDCFEVKKVAVDERISKSQITSFTPEIEQKLINYKNITEISKDFLNANARTTLQSLFSELIVDLKAYCDANSYINAEHIVRTLMTSIPLPNAGFFENSTLEELHEWQSRLDDISSCMVSLRLQQSNKLWSVEENSIFFSEIKILSRYLYTLSFDLAKQEIKAHINKEKEDLTKANNIVKDLKISVKQILLDAAKYSAAKGIIDKIKIKSTWEQIKAYFVSGSLDFYRVDKAKDLSRKYDEYLKSGSKVRDAKFQKIDEHMQNASKLIDSFVESNINLDKVYSDKFLESLSNESFLKSDSYKELKDILASDRYNVLLPIRNLIFGKVCKELKIPVHLLGYTRAIGLNIEPVMMSFSEDFADDDFVGLTCSVDNYFLTALNPRIEARRDEYRKAARILNTRLADSRPGVRLSRKEHRKANRAFMCGFFCDVKDRDVTQIILEMGHVPESEEREEYPEKKSLCKGVEDFAKELGVKSNDFHPLYIKQLASGFKTKSDIVNMFQPKPLFNINKHSLLCKGFGNGSKDTWNMVGSQFFRVLENKRAFSRGGLVDTEVVYLDNMEVLGVVYKAKNGKTAGARNGLYCISEKALLNKKMPESFLRRAEIEETYTEVLGVNHAVVSNNLSEVFRAAFNSDSAVYIPLSILNSIYKLANISPGEECNLLGIKSEDLPKNVGGASLFIAALESILSVYQVPSTLSNTRTLINHSTFKSAIAFMANWPKELSYGAVQDLVRNRLFNQNIIKAQMKSNPKEVSDSLLLLDEMITALSKDISNVEHAKVAMFCAEIMTRIHSVAGIKDKDLDAMVEKNVTLARDIFKYHIEITESVNFANMFLGIMTQFADLNTGVYWGEALLAYYLTKKHGISCSDVSAKTVNKTTFEEHHLKLIENKAEVDQAFRNSICNQVSMVQAVADWQSVAGSRSKFSLTEVDTKGKTQEKVVDFRDGEGFYVKGESVNYNVIPEVVKNNKDFKFVVGDKTPFVAVKFFDGNIVRYSWTESKFGIEFEVHHCRDTGDTQIFQNVNGTLFKFCRLTASDSTWNFLKKLAFGWTSTNERVNELIALKGIWIKTGRSKNGTLCLDPSEGRIAIEDQNITAPNVMKCIFSEDVKKIQKVYIGRNQKEGLRVCATQDQDIFQCCSANRIIALKDSSNDIVEYIFPNGSRGDISGKTICRSRKDRKKWVIKGKENYELTENKDANLAAIFGPQHKDYVLRFENKETGAEEFWVFPYDFASTTNKRGSKLVFLKNIFTSIAFRDSSRRMASMLLSKYSSIDAAASFKILNNTDKIRELSGRLEEVVDYAKEHISGAFGMKYPGNKDRTKDESVSKQTKAQKDLEGLGLSIDSILTDYHKYDTKSLSHLEKILAKSSNEVEAIVESLKLLLSLLERGEDVSIFLGLYKCKFQGLLEQMLTAAQDDDVSKSANIAQGMSVLFVVLDNLDKMISMQKAHVSASGKEFSDYDVLEYRSLLIKTIMEGVRVTKQFVGMVSSSDQLGVGHNLLGSVVQNMTSTEEDAANKSEGLFLIVQLLENLVSSGNPEDFSNTAPMVMVRDGAKVFGSEATWLYLASLEGLKKSWGKASMYLSQIKSNARIADLKNISNVLNKFLNNYEEFVIPFDDLTGINNRSSAEVAYMLKFGLTILQMQKRISLEYGFDILENTELSVNLLENAVSKLFDRYQVVLSQNNQYFIENKLSLSLEEIELCHSIKKHAKNPVINKVTTSLAAKLVLKQKENQDAGEVQDLDGVRINDFTTLPVPSEEEVIRLFSSSVVFMRGKVKYKSLYELKSRYGNEINENLIVSHFWDLWQIIYTDPNITINDLSFLWSSKIPIGNGSIADMKVARQLLLLLFYFQRNEAFKDNRTAYNPVMEMLFDGIQNKESSFFNNADTLNKLDVMAAEGFGGKKSFSAFSFGKKVLFGMIANAWPALRGKKEVAGIENENRSNLNDINQARVALLSIVTDSFRKYKVGKKTEDPKQNSKEQGLIKSFIETTKKPLQIEEQEGVYQLKGPFKELTHLLTSKKKADQFVLNLVQSFGFKITGSEVLNRKISFSSDQNNSWTKFSNRVDGFLNRSNLECTFVGEKSLNSSLENDILLKKLYCDAIVELKSETEVSDNILDIMWVGIKSRYKDLDSVSPQIETSLKGKLEDIVRYSVNEYKTTMFDFELTATSQVKQSAISHFSEVKVLEEANLDLQPYTKPIAQKSQDDFKQRALQAKQMFESVCKTEIEKKESEAIKRGLSEVESQIESSTSRVIDTSKLKSLIQVINEMIQSSKDKEVILEDRILSFLRANSSLLGFSCDVLEEEKFKYEGLGFILDLYANGQLSQVGDKDIAKEVETVVTNYLLVVTRKQQLEKALACSLDMKADVTRSLTFFNKRLSLEHLESRQSWRLQSADLVALLKGIDVSRYSNPQGCLTDQMFTRKCLVNEYLMGWIVREKTAKGLHDLLGDCKDVPQDISRFVRVIMGAGKTTCLLPIAVQILKSKSKKPVLVTTANLLDQTKEVLGSKGFLFRFSMPPYPADVHAFDDIIDKLEITEALLKDLNDQGCFVITSPQHLASLRNARVSYLERQGVLLERVQSGDYNTLELLKFSKTLDLLKKIEGFFKSEDTVFLQDEDVNLAITQEFNLAQGEKEPCDEVRINVAQRFIWNIFKDASLSMYAKMVVNSDFRSLSTVDDANDLKTVIGAKTAIAKSFYKDNSFWKLVGFAGGIAEEFTEKEFVDFVTGVSKELPQSILDRREEGFVSLDYLAALKVLLTKTFDSVKDCRAHLDRGMKSSNSVAVVPYSEGQEKPNMQFGEDFEMVLHTLLHYAHKNPRFSCELFYKFFNKYKSNDEPIAGSFGGITWKQWAKEIQAEQGDVYSSVSEAFEHSPNLALHRVLLSSVLLRESNYMGLHKSQIVCNSQDIALGYDARTVSGTGDSFEILGGDLEQSIKNLDADLSMGETILKADMSKEAIVFDSPFECMVDKVKDVNCVAFINCDYEMFGNSTSVLVSKLRGTKEAAGRQFIYRDETLTKLSLNPGENSSPNLYNPANVSDSAFVLYNTTDTRGVDIKIPRGEGKYGVVMIGLKNDSEMILQAIWRMRGLGSGQELQFAFDKKTEVDIRTVCGIDKDVLITSADVLKYGFKNTVGDKERKRLKVVMFKALARRKIALDKFARSKCDFQTFSDSSLFAKQIHMSCSQGVYQSICREVYIKDNVTDWESELRSSEDLDIIDFLRKVYKKEENKIEETVTKLLSVYKQNFLSLAYDGYKDREYKKLQNIINNIEVKMDALLKRADLTSKDVDKALNIDLEEVLSFISLPEGELVLDSLNSFLNLNKDLILSLCKIREDLKGLDDKKIESFYKGSLQAKVEDKSQRLDSGSEVAVQVEAEQELEVQQEQEQEQEQQTELRLLQQQKRKAGLSLHDVNVEDEDNEFTIHLMDLNMVKGLLSSSASRGLVSSIGGSGYLQNVKIGNMVVAKHLLTDSSEDLLKHVMFSPSGWSKCKNYYKAGTSKLSFILLARDNSTKAQKMIVLSNSGDIANLEEDFAKLDPKDRRFSYSLYPVGCGGGCMPKQMKPVFSHGPEFDFSKDSEEGRRLFAMMGVVKCLMNDSDMSYIEKKCFYEYLFGTKKPKTGSSLFSGTPVDEVLSASVRELERSIKKQVVLESNHIVADFKQASEGNVLEDQAVSDFWLEFAEQAICEGDEFFNEKQFEALVLRFSRSDGEAYCQCLKDYVVRNSYLSKAEKKRVCLKVDHIFTQVKEF